MTTLTGSLPPAKSFYERELGELRRPDRRGWAKPKCGCPFHASQSKTSFHVNLNTGAFNCFGCDAHGGDILQFVRLRYKLSFPAALKHFQIETKYRPPAKPKGPPMSVEQILARKLASAVEYGMGGPADGE